MTRLMAEVWQPGQIVWLTRKQTEPGTVTWEVVFELDDEPDLFRQTVVSDDTLYAGAKRGDEILVSSGVPQAVRPRT